MYDVHLISYLLMYKDVAYVQRCIKRVHTVLNCVWHLTMSQMTCNVQSVMTIVLC